MINSLDTDNRLEMLIGKCRNNDSIIKKLTNNITNAYFDKLYKDLDLELFNTDLSKNSLIGKIVTESERYNSRQPKVARFKTETISVVDNIKYELINENGDFRYTFESSTFDQVIKIKEMKIDLNKYNPFNLYISFLKDGEINSFISIYLVNNFIMSNCQILLKISNLDDYGDWINKFHSVSDYITNELGKIEDKLLRSIELKKNIDETLHSLNCYEKK